MEQKVFGCYIVECRDGTLYTGMTNDPERRLAAHNAGTGAAYTHGRRPVKLLYWEPVGSKGDALKREYRIKHLTRKQKLELINNGDAHE